MDLAQIRGWATSFYKNPLAGLNWVTRWGILPYEATTFKQKLRIKIGDTAFQHVLFMLLVFTT